jgi:hypothetical protein
MGQRHSFGESQGEEEQETERTHFTPTGGQPEGTKGNQRESDQSLVRPEERDHPCHIRAGRVQRLAHYRFPKKLPEVTETSGPSGFTLQIGRSRHRTLPTMCRSGYPHHFLP